MKNIYNFKKIVGITFSLIVVLIIYNGCDDNFLNVPPKGTLDENILTTAQGVEGTLISSYRLLGGYTSGLGAQWGAASSNWIWGSVTSDNAYKGSDAGDQAAIDDVELYNWSTGRSESYLNDKWNSQYEGVRRSNATINLLNKVLENSPDELSEAQARSIQGEAMFLRAHYHFEAWKMWKNIPYYTEEISDFRQPADPNPISKILSDLQSAIDLLQETPRNGEVGRVTKWTAKAYLGRVQIYSGDYESALTTLRDVRNNGPYELEENYHQVWTGFAEYANGPETILAYQASINDGAGGANANYGERLNFPHTDSPWGCCGFHTPTQNLVNFFRVDGDGLPLALTDPSWNDSDENFTNEFNNVPVDPRLDWTVGRIGVPYKDYGPHPRVWIRDIVFAGPYSPKKNVHEDASNAESVEGWNPQHLNSVNLHLYRYADLLLLLAEAEVEVGLLENAREIVNKIRQRAGVAAQGLGVDKSTIAVPLDDPSIDWANYQIGLYTSPWDQETARQAVRYERRLELAMEGHRLFDLRRWGIAPQILNDYMAAEVRRRSFLQGASKITERHVVYPIPAVQIELSRKAGEETLQQNPNW